MASKEVALNEPIEGEIVDGTAELADDVMVDERGMLEGSSFIATKAEAEELTAQLRATVEKARKAYGSYLTNYEQVIEYQKQGYDANVHVSLGITFKQWVKENCEDVLKSLREKQSKIPAKERKEISKALSAKGTSARHIAILLDVNPSTIDRDLADTEKPETVIGLDGKVQPKSKAKADKAIDDIVDAEVVDEPEAPAKPKQLPPAFADAVQRLSAVAAEIEQLSEDTRFKRASKKLAEEHGNSILVAVNSVLDLCDKMGLQVFATDEAIEEFIEETEANAEALAAAEPEAEPEAEPMEDGAAVDDSILDDVFEEEEF